MARAAAAVAAGGDPRVDPTRSGIEHVVVVMMENRSFDHILGWLPGADGVQAGLDVPGPRGRVATRPGTSTRSRGCGTAIPTTPTTAGAHELNDGALRRLAASAGTDDVFPIGYYEPSDLDFYWQAAPYWTVCDHFFASIMGPTYPNRFYMHTAQTDRITNDFSGGERPADDLGLAGRPPG